MRFRTPPLETVRAENAEMAVAMRTSLPPNMAECNIERKVLLDVLHLHSIKARILNKNHQLRYETLYFHELFASIK